MRIARVEYGGAARWAAIADGGAIDLTPILGGACDAVHTLFEPDGRHGAEDYVAGRSPDASTDELSFAPFLPAAEKIVGPYQEIRVLSYPGAPATPARAALTLDARDMVIGGVDIWGADTSICKLY